MFGLRGQELLIIIVLLLGLAAFVVLVVAFVKAATRLDPPINPVQQSNPEATASSSRSAKERLAELDALKESGTLSDNEYEAKRQQILDSI